MSDILAHLNEPQKEAVTTVEGPVMVIAGAGSGKTRALTHRIAYMIQEGISPFSIMALTFTNKAAKEMKERIMQLVDPSHAKSVWMGTFHSIFARILRIEAEHLGFTQNFTIYDTDDSKQLINNIIKEKELDNKVYPAKMVLNRISMAKSSLYNAEDYCKDEEIQKQDFRANKPLIGEIFKAYNERLKRANAMDFDDILYYTNVLLKDFPEILLKYQRHFKYILVDEYQDTNHAQYIIIRRIAAMHENICVVGDDAQSIYGFRGANIRNILNFHSDYPDMKLIRLEQNYRSTKTIVTAANNVIARNEEQIKKKVWSDNEEGELITLLRATTDNEEGTLIANSIFGFKMSRQLNYKDFAILYRTNSQSRPLEEALRKQDIPYRIYGGLSFYDRKEVKDLLAYFRLVVNTNDDQALLRIINYPTRGIGSTTQQHLEILADNRKCSIWDVISSDEGLPKELSRSLSKIKDFVLMIQSFRTRLEKDNAFELAKHITDTTGIIKVLKEDGDNVTDTTWSNVDPIDLRKPVKFKVYAQVINVYDIYTVEARVHQVDPMKMGWTKISDSFSGGEADGEQRSILFNGKIYTFAYTGGTPAIFSTDVNDGNSWRKDIPSFPESMNINSVCTYGRQIYMASTNGNVYTSDDGLNWSKKENLSGNILTFVGKMFS